MCLVNNIVFVVVFLFLVLEDFFEFLYGRIYKVVGDIILKDRIVNLVMVKVVLIFEGNVGDMMIF